MNDLTKTSKLRLAVTLACDSTHFFALHGGHGYTYPRTGYQTGRGRYRETFREQPVGNAWDGTRERNKRRRQAIRKARVLARAS